jgi:molybdopterin converting factor subunit 1
MRFRVRLFAAAKDLLRVSSVELDLPEGATVAQLRRRLAEEQPVLTALLERSALAVNDEFAKEETPLPAGAEIALLPPVSGGSQNGQRTLDS